MKRGTKLRLRSTGKVYEFLRVARKHRGITKVVVNPPEELGPMDLAAFDVLPDWPLKTSPEAYIARAESGQSVKEDTLALAKVIVGV